LARIRSGLIKPNDLSKRPNGSPAIESRVLRSIVANISRVQNVAKLSLIQVEL